MQYLRRCRGKGQTEEDLEEVLQEAVFEIVDGQSDFGDGNPLQKLHRRILYRARDLLWNRRRRESSQDVSLDKPVGTDDEVETHAARLADSKSDPPEKRVDHADHELADLAACRKTLSQDDRELIEQRFEQGRSYEDLADVLGVSKGAIRQRVSRATRRLRECMEQRGTAESLRTLRGKR